MTCTSQFLKTCAYMSNHGLIVWLRAFVTDLGKPTRRRVFACVLLCQRAGRPCARSLFISHNKIKPCTFSRHRTLHLKGSQSSSLTEWTRWDIRSRAKTSIQQLGTPVLGSWLVWTRSCPEWSSSLHDTNSAEGHWWQGMAVLPGHLHCSDGVRRAAPSTRGTNATLRLQHRCRTEVAAAMPCWGCGTDQNTWEAGWKEFPWNQLRTALGLPAKPFSLIGSPSFFNAAFFGV